MVQRRRKLIGSIGLVVAVSLLGSACSDDDDPVDSTEEPSGDAAAVGPDTAASTLRAGLTGLLSEHVYLAALSTGAALRGDNAGFEAFATALNGPEDSNTSDLVDGITAAYGEEVGTAFDGLWRSDDHIPAFVRYTQAVAADDQAAADAAVADLLDYADTFGETLESVNENLPAEAVAEGVKGHITTLKDVVDAQKAGDQPKVYSSLRTAYHHMGEFAATLADATAKKLPDEFAGDALSPAADLRSGLTSLLREHVFLASSATGAALGGRMPQFEAAAAALNGPEGSNTADLVAGVTSVYGDEVGTAFDGLWRSEGHIPAVVAYTQAIAAGDQAAADQAVADLLAYAKTFGDTMNTVNENLPAADVTAGVEGHATTLKAVIDAQKAGDAVAVARLVREAAAHMNHLADALATATYAKYPDKL